MAILIEGPCPKCDKHDYWWGYTKEQAEAMRQRKCWRCKLKRAILIAVVLGFGMSFVLRIIAGISGAHP